MQIPTVIKVVKMKAKNQYSFRVDRLKTLMGQRNQPEFAELVEINQSMLSKYLDGESQPSLPVIIRIATTLSVSVDWLLGLSDDPRLHIGALSDDEQLLILAWKSGNLEKLVDLLPKRPKGGSGGEGSASE